MQIRRRIAALMTALALCGGGATLAACGDPAGADRSDGSTDNTNNQGTDNTTQENDEDSGNLPNNSDPEVESDSDTQNPG